MGGFGSDFYGAGPYGVGTPADVDPNGGVLLASPLTGQSLGSRRIDPRSGDYVLDGFGRIEGMSEAQQIVLLAVATDLDSSSVRGLGNELRSIPRITANFERRVDTILRSALQDAVNRGLVQVVSVSVVQLAPGRAYAKLVWRDLTTNQEHTEDVGR